MNEKKEMIFDMLRSKKYRMFPNNVNDKVRRTYQLRHRETLKFIAFIHFVNGEMTKVETLGAKKLGIEFELIN